MTCATGFCNAIRVLILRREASPLPVAKPTVSVTPEKGAKSVPWGGLTIGILNYDSETFKPIGRDISDSIYFLRD